MLIIFLLKHTEQKRKRRFLRSARAQFLQERTLIFRLERNTLALKMKIS